MTRKLNVEMQRGQIFIDERFLKQVFRWLAWMCLSLLLLSCNIPETAAPAPMEHMGAGVSAVPTQTPLSVMAVATSMSEATSTLVVPIAELTMIPPDMYPSISPQQTLQHTVAPRETLLALALDYDVPMAAIQMQNGLGGATALQAGQVLDIPPASEWQGASPFWVVRPVEAGETLFDIAAMYDLDIGTLCAINNIADADFLSAGQPLILPLDAPADVVAQAALPEPSPVPPTPTPSPAPVVLETPPPSLELLPTPTPLPAPVEPLPADIAAWPAEVFRLVNAERAAHGLSPYTYNETLAQAARLHGGDCLQRGSCNHTGSDGSNVRLRAARAGYEAAGTAECIVYSTSPQAAVAWWMDEVPPNDWHRRTLLSTWVTEIGIAVIPIGQDYYYFIADFGRPGQ